MSNPLIDNLAWNPENPAASARALQTALTALQAEWELKTPITTQISRSGRVTAEDWNTDREDVSLLHFDPTVPEFRGEWTNVFGDIAPIESVAQPGFSEFIPFHVINGGVTITPAGGATIADITIDIGIPARLFIFIPLQMNDGSFSAVPRLNLVIDGNVEYDVIWRSASIDPDTIVFMWLSTDTYEGSVQVVLEAISSTGSGTHIISDIAPMPNVANTFTPPLLGLVDPPLGYVEVIYQ